MYKEITLFIALLALYLAFIIFAPLSVVVLFWAGVAGWQLGAWSKPVGKWIINNYWK